MAGRRFEFVLLGVLALLWGSSYMWISLALQTIPPMTLIALRVGLASLVLLGILSVRGLKLPTDSRMWRLLFVQSIVNSTGPWLLLAWGQQSVDSAVASVLNSTSPLFVFFFSLFLMSGSERPALQQFLGALAGMAGIVLIVGTGALESLGGAFIPQIAVLAGAALYGIAAIWGRMFSHLPPLATAAGTLICSTATLLPLSLVIDRPWTLQMSGESLAAACILSVFCTALAFLIYFRLINTIGPMGTSSQAYLRSGIGVVLGIVFLNEVLNLETFAGICLAIFGVVLINWRRPLQPTPNKAVQENSS
ncbi:EamA family transporter [Roseibium denhamense]|uniref:Permease of the drug/metabolite transporter (DMT) superfamily n=1 Tax=Roseibium denhamense TaxID=76305 RepID=A0ABY1N6U7_9HYPH|nr:EamA family transporter [Roseibium denhamense]MTI06053.1 EamA family transporter [Roseibium denhamense]SMP01636.1 Permease of the drug/metabolite transporter (DMT) superfamily [Roseibium denhamense]